MASLQHKHHKYNFTSKSNAANNRLRMNRLALLKRRAGTLAHQRLKDEDSEIESALSNEDAYNQVCYPAEQNEDVQSRVKSGNIDKKNDSTDDSSMSNIHINYCLATSESVCDTRDDYAPTNGIDARKGSISTSCTIAHAEGGTSEMKTYQYDSIKQRVITAMAKASSSTKSGSDETPTRNSKTATEIAGASSFISSLTDPTSYPTGNQELDRFITSITSMDIPKDIAAASQQKQSSATPMSFQTADHVPLLNLDKDSSLKDRALAVMEMLKVNGYFTKNGPTQSAISPYGADAIASETLSWQVSSLKSAENTPKSEGSSVKDIDIVITESQDEGGTDEGGKVSTLLNDFSVTVKQMINDTFTSDGHSDSSQVDSLKSAENAPKSEGSSVKDIDIVITESQDERDTGEAGNVSTLLNDFSVTVTHSSATGDSIPSLRDPPDDEHHSATGTVPDIKNEGDTTTDGLTEACGPAKRRISLGIAKVIKRKKSRTRSDSLSSAGSHGCFDGSISSVNEAGVNASSPRHRQRFSMSLGGIKPRGSNRMRSDSIGSISSTYSKDSSIMDPSMHSFKKLTMNISNNFKRLHWSRTSSTSQSSDNSVPSLYDDESLPEQVDEDVSLPSLDDDEVSFENYIEPEPSPPVFLSSPVTVQSDQYAYSSALDSSNHSIDQSESSDDSSSTSSDQSSCSGTETIDGINNQSMILTALTKLGLKNSTTDKIADYVTQENAKLNVQKDTMQENKEFSINDKFSPSKETLGLEMIAHPALLHKYD